MKHSLALFFLLIFICYEADAQSLINGKDYNDLNNWMLYSRAFRVKNNEKTGKENAYHLYFSNRTLEESIYWRYKQKPEAFDICASLVIPQDSIHFSFNINSLKVDSLLFKIVLYKNNEEFLEQHVYPLDKNGANKISFKNRDATVMDAHIYGKTMVRHDSIALKITDFNLSASAHDLSEMINVTQSRINESDITPLPQVCDLDEFRRNKIIGLGESIYGSRSIHQQKNNIIEKLVENTTLRLICFEIGIDLVMNWDLYIQGILPYSYRDKIMEEMDGSSWEAGLTMELLDKLRETNHAREPKDRIHVVGLDTREDDFYVFEYFRGWQEHGKGNKFLDDVLLKMDTLNYNQLGSLIFTIINGESKTTRNIIPKEKEYKSLVDILIENEKLQELMDEKEFRFLTEGFLLDIPTSDDAFNVDSVMEKRDTYMWKILQLAIDCYAPAETDKVVIDAHSMHLSRTHNPYSIAKVFSFKNLGEYIADEYVADFLTVSLHTGRGKYKTYSKGVVGEGDLQEPPYNSFEWVASKTNLDAFYCETTDLDMVNSFRSLTIIPSAIQFYSLSKYRFDGYVYIEESEACTPVQYDGSTKYAREKLKRDYTDSLKIVYTPYSSFNYKVFTDTISKVDVFNPDGFRWKRTRLISLFYNGNLNYAGVFRGFFESKDRECIIMIDNLMFPMSYNKSSSADKRDIMTEANRSFLNKDFVPKSVSGKIGTPQKAKETPALNRLNYRSESYAKQTFNADKVAEATLIMSPNDRLQIFGPYNHGEAIMIEKDGGTINLKCFYTDKGYKNKRKYRKTIESLVRFK